MTEKDYKVLSKALGQAMSCSSGSEFMDGVDATLTALCAALGEDSAAFDEGAFRSAVYSTRDHIDYAIYSR